MLVKIQLPHRGQYSVAADSMGEGRKPRSLHRGFHIGKVWGCPASDLPDSHRFRRQGDMNRWQGFAVLQPLPHFQCCQFDNRVGQNPHGRGHDRIQLRRRAQ